ncbi:hypothetical protein ACFPN2_21600 [Steroidobacter flavus]|uniref:Uncharacterized protein n=1 Tax=Steroidobacter flavus TaxID=1842136 RepID=A0ABV8SX74_9GAMM
MNPLFGGKCARFLPWLNAERGEKLGRAGLGNEQRSIYSKLI